MQDRAVVVITGASRGIGLGVACWLAVSRCPLMLTARDATELERVATWLRSQGAVVEHVACDVADEPAMARALGAATAMGPIGGMLNNAGVLEPVGPIQSLDVSAFESHMRTNVTGVLVGMRQALAHRKPEHPLRIVNVSSGAATRGYRGWAAYCASKAAVNIMTQVASLEADSMTSIVAVAPGIIETRMQRIIREMPEDRFPDVDDFRKLKQQGELLHPVDAAIALAWLLRTAPLSLSGRFLDARGDGVLRDRNGEGESAVLRAKQWFDVLEAEA